MRQERNPSFNTKEFQNKVSKTVVVLFPDIRTTGGLSKTSPDYVATLLTGQFFSTVEKLLKRYKREGFKIIGVLYNDSTHETFSGLFPEETFDGLVRLEEDFDHWSHEDYNKELPEVINAFNLVPQAHVIVGGYHAKDCVVYTTATLRELGFVASSDLRLTDELPFLLISHQVRKAVPSIIRNDIVHEDKLIWENLKERQEELVRSTTRRS